MIYFNGVNLKADGWEELHEFARKMGVGRSWFSLEPAPHYDVICAFKRAAILEALSRKEKHAKRKKENGKV